MKTGTNSNTKLCKIVYLDEGSVTDYIQIVEGGELEKTTELLENETEAGKGKIDASTKISVGTIFKSLGGFKATAEVNAGLTTEFNANNMVKNILKNTILTDFINKVENKKDSEKCAVKKFIGYKIEAPKDSLSYVALISPYLNMLKSGTTISSGEIDISVDKLDKTIKEAKGYYEFLGKKENENVIFRFNINSFKNNYKVTDLMKMENSIYAIKVGKSTVDKLNFSNEFDIETSNVNTDNPRYKMEEISNAEKYDKRDELDVYDVLLVGVEIND